MNILRFGRVDLVTKKEKMPQVLQYIFYSDIFMTKRLDSNHKWSILFIFFSPVRFKMSFYLRPVMNNSGNNLWLIMPTHFNHLKQVQGVCI